MKNYGHALIKAAHVGCNVFIFFMSLIAFPLFSQGQIISTVTHNDLYDFNGTQTNLIANPDFEVLPAGFTNQAWYAVINTSSACGYNIIPGWQAGPVGSESYATLTLLRPSGANFIFNDAYPALGSSGVCSGTTYPVTPDDVMKNAPLAAATNATTNWMMYFGNWEEVIGITGAVPAVNMLTGEVMAANSTPSFFPNGSGATSVGLPKPFVFIEQTVHGLTACHSYELEFFITGEGFPGSVSAGPSAAFYPADGILQLTIGSQVVYLMSPGTGNFHGLGSSEIYHITFDAAADSVQIRMASPGHMLKITATNSPAWASYFTAPPGALGVAAGSRQGSSEVLLDGVRLFEVATANCSLLDKDIGAFTARRTDHQVQLSWQVSPGHGTRRYIIQRSTDGQAWDSIGVVYPAPLPGNPDLRQDMQFFDQSPFPRANYYQLKIQYASGGYGYSEVRQADIDGGDDTGITISPNPASDGVVIRGIAGEIFPRVILTNALAQLILVKKNFHTGDRLDISSCHAGIYWLKIITPGGQVITKKLVRK